MREGTKWEMLKFQGREISLLLVTKNIFRIRGEKKKKKNPPSIFELVWWYGCGSSFWHAQERSSGDSYLSKWATMVEGLCSFRSTTLCNLCLNQGSTLDWQWSVRERGLESVLCWLVLLGVIAMQSVGEFRWASEAFSRMWAIDRLTNILVCALQQFD